MSIALLLLPDFSLILLGALLRRFAGFDDSFWSGLERLVYFVLFPALLLISTSSTKLDAAGTGLVVALGFAVTASGVLLGFLVYPWFRHESRDFASAVQTAYRFNSYIALAVAGRMAGVQGTALMALLVGTGVPLANAAAVFGLARHGGSNLLGALVRNPLIISTLLGFCLNLAGVTLPEFATLTLGRLGNASVALGLITVGAGLRIGTAKVPAFLSAWCIGIKLLALPAIALVLARWLELDALPRQILVLFAALPSASSAYILATRMGGNGPLVAFLLSLGTLLSVLTLPLWLTLAH